MYCDNLDGFDEGDDEEAAAVDGDGGCGGYVSDGVNAAGVAFDDADDGVGDADFGAVGVDVTCGHLLVCLLSNGANESATESCCLPYLCWAAGSIVAELVALVERLNLAVHRAYMMAYYMILDNVDKMEI